MLSLGALSKQQIVICYQEKYFAKLDGTTRTTFLLTVMAMVMSSCQAMERVKRLKLPRPPSSQVEILNKHPF